MNDSYGHECGDKVLRMVAHTLIKTSRSFDTIGRWEGEEFIILVPNVDEKLLTRIAERYRALVAKSFISHAGATMAVTISIGAILAASGEEIENLLSRVDKLLYLSKKQGRNCVTCGGD